MPQGGSWTALVNGRILTMDPEQPSAQAVLVRGESIVMVGGDQAVQCEVPGDAQIIDLKGRTVTPGLIDSHLHLLSYGFNLGQVDLAGARDLSDFLNRVERFVRDRPEGSWITGRGWDQERFREKRYPGRRDLDRVAPAHPVLLRRTCGHVAVANSLALQLAGVTADTPDPPGGRIDREPESGEPTGILREQAAVLVSQRVPPPDFDASLRALARGIRRALASGLTGVHTQDVWGAGQFQQVRRLYAELRAQGTAIRVYQLVGDAELDALLDLGERTGMGDAYFKTGPIKIFADGSLGGSTAALLEPYHGQPGNRGLLIHSREELHELMGRAHRAGFQVAVHAIGDRAAQLALEGFAMAQERHPRPDPRHRLIHCQIMQPEQWDTMRRLGVLADIQPKFVSTDLHFTKERVGPVRARHAYAWRSLLAAGVRAAASSDAPVEPIEPMLGVYAAVLRRDLGDYPREGWHPEQALDVATTLDLFTRGSAYAAFEEGYRGRLAPGYLADMVVWPEDPCRLPPAEIKDLTPDLTLLGGRVVYRRPD